MKRRVPDVSQHQGKIKWDKLKDKIPFAIIRIGYGDDIESQDDLYAVYNMKECARLGIPFMVYIYSYASSVSQVLSEIEHTKRMCKGFSPLQYWLDLEERAYTGIWKKATELWMKAFPAGGVYSWQWAFEKQLKGVNCGRWIAAYGKNNGYPDKAYKPTIDMDGWQYTSKAVMPGISGVVDMSEWYVEVTGTQPIEIKAQRRAVTRKEVAALIMRHLCCHKDHGYTQDMSGRQGTGTETIDIYGKKYTIKGSDRDCSSAVISAYEAAGISCGGATYTRNMKKCMCGTGNFVWRSMNFVAQMGDTYLNEKNHTAMCLSAEPDVLMEFSINEHGKALGGQKGDQKQNGNWDASYGRGESHLRMYYDYPWNGILQCVNDEIAFYIEEDGTITDSDKDDGYTGGNKMVIIEPDKSDTDLAVEVLFDVHGSGQKRKDSLGGRYDSVQAEVTGLWNNPASRTTAEKAYFKKFGCNGLI